MVYNWQQQDWPNFRYDLSSIADDLVAFAEKSGHVGGMFKALSETAKTQVLVDLMVSEAIKNSEIEGEFLSRVDVMSSIRNNLGLPGEHEQVRDQRAKGAADLTSIVRSTFREPLVQETLFEWHKMLLGEQHGKLLVGAWRTHDEPMQIISSPIGKEKIHFEAPPSHRVGEEMNRFMAWFNETAPDSNNAIKNPIVRAAIAHLYFESIHPFEDGNGRIGRAISEKALSQGLGRPVLLSVSKGIESNKKAYYAALKSAQRSNEISHWLAYFLHTVIDAQLEEEKQIDFILQKTQFFDQFADKLNTRQMKVIRRMLAQGPKGFTGGMSTKKYIAITTTSKATASRDLQYLTNIKALKQTGGGRSTRYGVNLKG